MGKMDVNTAETKDENEYYRKIKMTSVKAAVSSVALTLVFGVILTVLAFRSDILYNLPFSWFDNYHEENYIFADREYHGENYDIVINELTVDSGGEHIHADLTIKNKTSSTIGYRKSDFALVKYVRNERDTKMTYIPDAVTGDIEASPGEECDIGLDFDIIVIESEQTEVSYSILLKHSADEEAFVLGYYDIL